MKTLHVKDRIGWRAWLQKNARSSKEIWLVYYKKNSGKQRIPYEDAVEEALCFGWIDSTVKKIDEERYAQRFTARKPRSRWSALNVKRARRLMKQGKMTAAGLQVFHPRNTWPPQPTQLPKDLEARFKKQTSAWDNFNCFPPFYRRVTIAWVASAKKEETRLKRLNQLIAFSAANKRIKLM